jgi:hypothetical protein
LKIDVDRQIRNHLGRKDIGEHYSQAQLDEKENKEIFESQKQLGAYRGK